MIDAPVDALGTTFKAGTRLSWHPTGEVAGGWLREVQEVAGFPIRYEFKAYASGTLRTFQLAEPRTIGGHAFPDWARIWLRRDGSLQQAEYVSDEGYMPHGEQWTDTLHLRFDCSGNEIDRYLEHWQAESRSP